MTEATDSYAVPLAGTRGAARRAPGRAARHATVAAFWLLLPGNAAAMVYLWVAAGNVSKGDAADVLTSLGRITGFLSAYLALLQVLLLARLQPLERLVGLDGSPSGTAGTAMPASTC